MLTMLAANRIPLLASHFMWPGVGHVAAHNEGFHYYPLGIKPDGMTEFQGRPEYWPWATVRSLWSAQYHRTGGRGVLGCRVERRHREGSEQMSHMPSVLISGASIAGPALAYWLEKAGFQVTVVERSPAPRTGGQAIDIRGPALDVIERMDLLADVQSRRTHHKGMSVLDASGRELSRTTEQTATAGRFDSGDIEIFRDDLSRLLVGSGDRRTEYRYGDTITGLRQDDDAVHVTFETAPPRTFDIVVGADGLHSRTRGLAFPAEDAQALVPIGVGFAIFTTPNILDLKDWQLSFRDETSGYAIYPTLDNAKLRTSLGFQLLPEDMPHGDFGAEVTLIRTRCAHMQGAVPTLLNGLTEQSDLWFGPLAQVRMDTWSKGRIALVGDAAYCPSPLTGQGTSLALIGAYVLAKELERSPQAPAEAFTRCEVRMGRFVRLNQDLLALEGPTPVPDEIFNHAKNAINLRIYF